jgi:hypothetical protein
MAKAKKRIATPKKATKRRKASTKSARTKVSNRRKVSAKAGRKKAAKRHSRAAYSTVSIGQQLDLR